MTEMSAKLAVAGLSAGTVALGEYVKACGVPAALHLYGIGAAVLVVACFWRRKG